VFLNNIKNCIDINNAAELYGLINDIRETNNLTYIETIKRDEMLDQL